MAANGSSSLRGRDRSDPPSREEGKDLGVGAAGFVQTKIMQSQNDLERDAELCVLAQGCGTWDDELAGELVGFSIQYAQANREVFPTEGN